MYISICWNLRAPVPLSRLRTHNAFLFNLHYFCEVVLVTVPLEKSQCLRVVLFVVFQIYPLRKITTSRATLGSKNVRGDSYTEIGWSRWFLFKKRNTLQSCVGTFTWENNASILAEKAIGCSRNPTIIPAKFCWISGHVRNMPFREVALDFAAVLQTLRTFSYFVFLSSS